MLGQKLILRSIWSQGNLTLRLDINENVKHENRQLSVKYSNCTYFIFMSEFAIITVYIYCIINITYYLSSMKYEKNH